MCGPLLALFVLLPIAEIVVLVQVGQRIGALETVALVCATSGLGVAILRRLGWFALRRLSQGLPPQAELLSGPLLVLAALLLVFPGFLTDVVGLLLLVPPLRRAVARSLAKRLHGRVFVAHHGFPEYQRPGEPPDVIEGEIVRREQRDTDDEP